MIKGSIQQQDITITNPYVPKNRIQIHEAKHRYLRIDKSTVNVLEINTHWIIIN